MGEEEAVSCAPPFSPSLKVVRTRSDPIDGLLDFDHIDRDRVTVRTRRYSSPGQTRGFVGLAGKAVLSTGTPWIPRLGGLHAPRDINRPSTTGKLRGAASMAKATLSPLRGARNKGEQREQRNETAQGTVPPVPAKTQHPSPSRDRLVPPPPSHAQRRRGSVTEITRTPRGSLIFPSDWPLSIVQQELAREAAAKKQTQEQGQEDDADADDQRAKESKSRRGSKPAGRRRASASGAIMKGGVWLPPLSELPVSQRTNGSCDVCRERAAGFCETCNQRLCVHCDRLIHSRSRARDHSRFSLQPRRRRSFIRDVVCYLCGRKQATPASVVIHMEECAVARLYRYRDLGEHALIRRPVLEPCPPRLAVPTEGASKGVFDRYNAEAMSIFTTSQPECKRCGRCFNPESIFKHLRTHT